MITAKSINEKEYFYGHKACGGCGGSLVVRQALKVLGDKAVSVLPAGCMSAVGFNYPQLAFSNNSVISMFAGTASMLTGIEAGLRARGINDFTAIGFAGDGGTADIGLQALSGAIDRNDNIIYICYDNEAYMNTGIQRSGATPFGATTTTSPKGKASFGEDKPKKNMPMIMAAHGVPYVATASIAYPEDFMKKVKKSAEIDGPAYIHLNQPCTTGWGYDSSKTIEIGRLAVETGSWILYEIENGEFNITYRPTERKPVKEYLKPQKRFRHLDDEHIDKIQEFVDKECAELGL